MIKHMRRHGTTDTEAAFRVQTLFLENSVHSAQRWLDFYMAATSAVRGKFNPSLEGKPTPSVSLREGVAVAAAAAVMSLRNKSSRSAHHLNKK